MSGLERSAAGGAHRRSRRLPRAGWALAPCNPGHGPRPRAVAGGAAAARDLRRAHHRRARRRRGALPVRAPPRRGPDRTGESRRPACLVLRRESALVSGSVRIGDGDLQRPRRPAAAWPARRRGAASAPSGCSFSATRRCGRCLGPRRALARHRRRRQLRAGAPVNRSVLRREPRGPRARRRRESGLSAFRSRERSTVSRHPGAADCDGPHPVAGDAPHRVGRLVARGARGRAVVALCEPGWRKAVVAGSASGPVRRLRRLGAQPRARTAADAAAVVLEGAAGRRACAGAADRSSPALRSSRRWGRCTPSAGRPQS